MPLPLGMRRRAAQSAQPRQLPGFARTRHSYARALRCVGDRLLNVACAMLRTGAQFNPSLEGQKRLLADRRATARYHKQPR